MSRPYLGCGTDVGLNNFRGVIEARRDLWHAATGVTWYVLLNIYSKKRLTFEEDRLNATQGVARHFAEQERTEYSNWVLSGHVAKGLTWHTIPLEPDSDCSLKQDWAGARRFPIWCWASSCPVKFKNWMDTVFLQERHARWLFPLQLSGQEFSTDDDMSADENSSIDDSTHRDQETKLHIKAPLIEVSLERQVATIERGAALLIKKDSLAKPVSFHYECSLDSRLEKDCYPTTFQMSNNGENWTAKEAINVKWLLLGGDRCNERYT